MIWAGTVLYAYCPPSFASPPSPRAEPGSPSPPPRRAAVLLALLALAAVVLVARPAHGWLLDRFAAAELVIRQQPVVGMLVFVLFAAVSAMVGFVSSAVLIPVAIYVWGPTVCFILLWAGWFLGGLAAYGIGRYLGRPVVHRLVHPRALERQERWARSGGRSLAGILLLQLAIPSDLAGYVFGLIRCPFRSFVVALALVEIPYALGAVFLGVSFVQRRLVPLLILGVAGTALSVLAFRAYHRRVGISPRVAEAPSR
ncbi:MAG TPA: VTT domain-containing protein [Gemmatimonadales bacterium]